MNMSVKDAAKSGNAEIVRVNVKPEGYDILIGDGILEKAGSVIGEMFADARAVIVTDETVDGLHGERLRESLGKAGVGNETIALKPGEESKRAETLMETVEAILAGAFERRDVLIAFGGGVVGDLGGFAAAIARRGMGLVQMPTSLLAQVDSAVGGKTGINSPKSGKNLIGAFYQPAVVLSDTGLLETLPEREMRAGYAEIVKYALIDKPLFFDWLEENGEAVMGKNGGERRKAIALACEAKAEIVGKDEFERGERALLNLGHTFGHALEASMGYEKRKLIHGEAVAIGMVLAHRFSEKSGLCAAADCERIEAHLRRVGLPVSPGDIDGAEFCADEIMEKMAQDKKVSKGELTFILSRGLGKAFIARDIDADSVREFLSGQLEGAR